MLTRNRYLAASAAGLSLSVWSFAKADHGHCIQEPSVHALALLAARELRNRLWLWGGLLLRIHYIGSSNRILSREIYEVYRYPNSLLHCGNEGHTLKNFNTVIAKKEQSKTQQHLPETPKHPNPMIFHFLQAAPLLNRKYPSKNKDYKHVYTSIALVYS